MVQGHIKTDTSIGGTSGVWWIEAGQYGCIIEDLRNGSFRRVHGDAATRKALQNIMPWGWRVSFVKEIPERKIHGGKANLVNNAVVGFFAGICSGSAETWSRAASA